ncbi:MAG: hypothetical protein KKH02_06655 [Proteobacteria bacterium]|nr:hypothetical protein [Pseudomonadota bacterium]MCG2740213.1 hypothetical protein [Syntrophaceae bacterium]
MISRKQFLNEIVIRGLRALAPFGEASGESGAGLSSDCHALTELSPSLLKIEAERLGIDPAHVDESELRSKVYAALSEQRR